MRKIKLIAVASAIVVVGLAATSALYAHDADEPRSSAMGPGMMGQGGMMNMMAQMEEMMESCSKMMQAMGRHGTEGGNAPGHQHGPETETSPDTNG